MQKTISREAKHVDNVIGKSAFYTPIFQLNVNFYFYILVILLEYLLWRMKFICEVFDTTNNCNVYKTFRFTINWQWELFISFLTSCKLNILNLLTLENGIFSKNCASPFPNSFVTSQSILQWIVSGFCINWEGYLVFINIFRPVFILV